MLKESRRRNQTGEEKDILKDLTFYCIKTHHNINAKMNAFFFSRLIDIWGSFKKISNVSVECLTPVSNVVSQCWALCFI